MSTQISNHQIYNQQQFAQQQTHGRPEQSPNYGGAKDIALENTNAGYIASKFDVMQHPLLVVKNTILGLAAAIGLTKLADVLVTPDYKKLPAGATHQEALKQTPLYKFSEKIDKLVDSTKFLPKVIEKAGELKNKTMKFLGKNDILSEMGSKIKEGAKNVWQNGKVYEYGKGNEALEEFVEFIEKSKGTMNADGKLINNVYEEVIPDIAKRTKIDELLKQMAEKKILKAEVAEKIIKEKILEDVPVENLKKYLNKSTIDKISGTTANLNSSIAKAKFFNNNVKGLKSASKAISNFILMALEGVGGGVLGGKAAMVMSVIGLVSAFNACSKAGIAKKEKEKQIKQRMKQGGLTQEQLNQMKKGPWSGEYVSAFMEDFSGFTVGAYIMTFPLGVGLNKVLGLANLGRDKELAKQAAKNLGLHGEKQVYQRGLIEYNEIVKNNNKMQKFLDILENKRKNTLFNRFKKTFGLTTDKDIQAGMVMVEKLKLKIDPKSSKEEIIAAIKEAKSQRSDKWFKETRTLLKKAGKSQLTFMSIFKENAYNKGSFIKRLGRFAIQKPFEIAAKIVGVGKFKLLEKNTGFVSGLKNRFKGLYGFGGGLGRMALVAFILTVPFRNKLMEISHKIFGKPSFSQYDEVKGVYEKEEEDKNVKIDPKRMQVPDVELPSKPKIKLPQQETGQIFTPAYQQQATLSNPYENRIKPQENEIVFKNQNLPDSNQVRNLDNYSYVPKF